MIIIIIIIKNNNNNNNNNNIHVNMRVRICFCINIKNIATENNVGTLQIIARRGPSEKGPPHDRIKQIFDSCYKAILCHSAPNSTQVIIRNKISASNKKLLAGST